MVMEVDEVFIDVIVEYQDDVPNRDRLRQVSLSQCGTSSAADDHSWGLRTGGIPTGHLGRVIRLREAALEAEGRSAQFLV